MNAWRHAISAFAFTILWLSASDAHCQSPASPSASESFEVVKKADISYCEEKNADPERHKLDVYSPKGLKDRPVLFFVHGGSWKSGSKGLYAAIGSSFAKAGYVVVVINYRLTPQVVHPGHIEDVARAFAWTADHIKDYGGDAKKIFPFGHSAGGHLVALLATNPAYLKAVKRVPGDIRGVIGVSGVYEIPADYSFFEPVFGKDEKVCKLASPRWCVAGNEPPFLVAYGDSDYEHLDEMAINFEGALNRCKSPVTLLKLKDRNHFTIIMKVIAADDPLHVAIREFVDKNAK